MVSAMDFVPSFFWARHGKQSLSCSGILNGADTWTGRLPLARRGLSADDDNRVDNRRTAGSPHPRYNGRPMWGGQPTWKLGDAPTGGAHRPQVGVALSLRLGEHRVRQWRAGAGGHSGVERPGRLLPA